MEDVNEKTLYDIEKELEDIFETDRKGWVKMYRLLNVVETKNLWDYRYGSFSAWLRDYAGRKGISEALLWHRRQAGRFYDQFALRAKLAGITEPPLEEVEAPVESLNIAERIAGKSAGKSDFIADDLIHKIINKEITRQDLSSAWKNVKAENLARKKAYIEFREPPALASNIALITTNDIILSLRKNYWLPDALYEEDTRRYVNDKKYIVYGYRGRIRPMYRTAADFNVFNKATKKDTNIDLMVAENCTVDVADKGYRLNLHAIAVKVDKKDFLSTGEMDMYRLYADYCWLAVPEEICQDALEFVPDDWGVILSDGKTATVVKIPAKITEYLSTHNDALMCFMLQYQYQ